MNNNTKRFAAYGAAFGALFPLLALAVTLYTSGLGWSAAGVGAAHRSIPLLWMIDTAPLFLGVFAAFAGRRQDQLEQVVEGLEATVQKRTQSLEEALAEAQEARHRAVSADQTKSRFLATMSHELRTPLNAIIGFSKILLKNKPGNQREKDITHLSRINENGKHLLGLINEVLDISKIEAGQMTYRHDACSLRSIADSVIHLQESLASNKGIALSTDIEESLSLFRADEHRLKQVLINLVGNAIKFTEKGVVTICAKTYDDGTSIQFIDVTDTGMGIAEEDLPTIFRPFEQADGDSDRQYEGTGLGLAISRKLCEGMGLSLEALSEPGKGSTFRVVVPKSHSDFDEVPAMEATGSDSSDSADCPPGEGRKRVLVVDDNADARQLIAEQLRELDCDVRLARDGGECLRIARAWHPDLITLDLMMPAVNGWQVLSKVRADSVLAKIPVVVVSMVADESRGTLGGALEVLKKPITRDDLVDVLARVHAATRRALIVEDNPDARAVLANFLEEEGWEVAEAIDGIEGLAAITRFSPDVVFLDLMMPVMDGAEFLERVRAKPALQDLPIIVVTAKELSTDESAEILRKADSVVLKGDTLLADLDKAVAQLSR